MKITINLDPPDTKKVSKEHAEYTRAVLHQAEDDALLVFRTLKIISYEVYNNFKN